MTNTESETDFEGAADKCCEALDRLDPESQRALLVRLLTVGALDAGDLSFINEIANKALADALKALRGKRRR
jgi:hypothetical protein